MFNILFSLLLFSLVQASGLERLGIKNLDIDYTMPHGKAFVEKVDIGLSFAPVPYALDILRRDNSIDFQSAFFDFSWLNPVAFIHDIHSVSGKLINLSISRDEHFADAEHFIFGPKQSEEYLMEGLKAKCTGSSSLENIGFRLVDDCLEKLDLKARKIDVPLDFFLLQILSQLPQMPDEMEFPGHELSLTTEKGNFSLVVFIKRYITAGLRARGHISLKNERKLLVIRVDQVKFGYLPITTLVLRELKNRIKHPAVKVEPPYIRIEL